jgi:hypothetical protein
MQRMFTAFIPTLSKLVFERKIINVNYGLEIIKQVLACLI